MTFLEALKNGELILKKADQNLDIAKLLILHYCKMEPADLYANLENEIDFDYSDYINAIYKYIDGVPLQHLRGYEYFYGRKFIVNSDVFIPRPETELLCDLLIQEANEYINNSLYICDVGTGSGAIAVTLSLELNNVYTYATEINPKSIVAAQQNAINNKSKVNFLQGDLIEPLIEKGLKFNVIACNLPYIPDNEELPKRVLDFDPKIALFGGSDGLDYFRKLFKNLTSITKEKWVAGFEFGANSKNNLEDLVKSFFPGNKYKFYKDYNDLWRILIIWG